jgi:hypothetical protein
LHTATHQPNSQVCSSLYCFNSTHIYSFSIFPNSKTLCEQRKVSVHNFCFAQFFVFQLLDMEVALAHGMTHQGKPVPGIEGLAIWTDKFALL